MLSVHGVSDALADEDNTIDDDIPESHRRLSFAGAKTSREEIASHLYDIDNTVGSKLRRATANLFFGHLHVRVVFSLLVACVLGAACCSYTHPERKEDWLDLCVFSLIYGAWFVFCVPMLIASINVRLMVQILHVLLRVFFAELAVMAYAYYRGHNNVLRRGFGMFHTLEANRAGKGLAWLGEAGYNLRQAALISCVVMAIVITCMEVWANQSIDLY